MLQSQTNEVSKNKWKTIKKKQRVPKQQAPNVDINVPKQQVSNVNINIPKQNNINDIKQQVSNVNIPKQNNINAIKQRVSNINIPKQNNINSIISTKIVDNTNVSKIEQALKISKYILDTNKQSYLCQIPITHQLNTMSLYSFSKNNPDLIPDKTVIPYNICAKKLIEAAIKNNPKLNFYTIRSPSFSSIFFPAEYIERYECVIYVELKNKTIKNNILAIWYNGYSTSEGRTVEAGYNSIIYTTFGELKRALEIGIYQKEHPQNQYW